MSKRYHETPMDFEYQNGTGPMDAKSPFAAVSMNAQRFPATPSGAGSRKSVFSFAWKKDKDATATDAAPPKGDYNAFDSPTRPGASRNPSPNKALPPVPGFNGIPAFNAMFATPRKTMQDTHMEDSSAGETPKSPERQDDSEAGTPAEKLAYERRRLGGGLDTRSAPAVPTVASMSMSPSKEMGRERTRDRERERRDRRPSPGSKKESFFGRVKRSFNSPGRGEVPRADASQNRDHRVRRQKSQRSLALALQKRYSDESHSGSEADDSELTIPPQSISPRKRSANYNQQPSVEPQQQQQQQQQQPPPQKEPGLISSLFTFISAHPTVPHILSFYAQLLFNIFLLSGCAYLIYSFWCAVQGDVNKKAFEASADIIAEIMDAKEHYAVNECAAKDRPGLKALCDHWGRIMDQDPYKIARAKVSAHTFAEIFNSFVEPISYKAMLFTALIVFGCFAVSNFAFGVLRNKAMEQHQPQQNWGGPYSFQAPPPTPQRSFSGMIEGQGTPWHGGPALEPAPSQRYDLGDGQGSPRRRLVYN
jgi:hypothetical protein